MYATPVTIYQGIDNPIQVRVRNQDQKSVDMTGRTMQVDIQNPDTQLTEYSLGINFTNRSKGYGTFIITRNVANNLKQRLYKLTFRSITDANNQEQPLFADDNFNVAIDLIVKPAYYSDMLPQEGELDDFNNIDGGNTP